MPKKRASTKTKNTPEIPATPLPQPTNQAAKRWLWIWVSFFTIIIIGLWAWATKISLSTFHWNKTPEKELLDTSKDDWNKLFNQENDRIKKEQLKRQVQNMINQIVTQATSSTPTSTITASSTITTTSTATTTTKN